MNEEKLLIHLTIDDKSITVPKGTSVYTAAKANGIELPVFCYQDRMPAFGACRVCLVEVEKMNKLQTSCTLEATEGMVVHTQTKIAVDGRKGILEFLLINHPLDCPICDRGGECPLQDNVLQFGPGKSEFFEEKRHFTKAKPLGPVLMLDRERCIVCARCTRFGDEIAGDHALEFIERGFKTEVGTPDGGVAQSKYIGNTIMICPVGALTSNVYRFRARPWDNDSTETTCTLCPVGCSMILDARDGEIVRTRSKENHAVNDIWLCDKGWFGYEFVENANRLTQPLIRRNGALVPASWDDALSFIAAKFKEAKPSGKLAAFGGNPLTVEENYLFQKLFRDGARTNNVDHRIGTPLFTLEEEGFPSSMEMTIGDCENLSYAVILGCDLTEQFPLLWLRLKKAINKGCKVIFMGHFAPEISSHLSKTILHPPGKELAAIKEYLPLIEKNKKGALFVGSQYLNTPHRQAILAALVDVQNTLPDLSLNLLEGKNNSVGARLAGMHPEVGPLGERLVKPGFNARQVLEHAQEEGWNFLYVAGANPATRFPSSLWESARKKIGFLVVNDLFLTETAKQADVVLPTLSYIEKEGSFINIEGRIQKVNPGKAIPPNILSDGDIFMAIANRLGMSLSIDPTFIGALQNAYVSIERPKKIHAVSKKASEEGLKATFAPALFDRGVRMRHNAHLVQMSKDPSIRLHPTTAKNKGIQEGALVSIDAKGNTIKGKATLDKGVAEGTLVIPLGFPEIPAHNLASDRWNGLQVEITLRNEQ